MNTATRKVENLDQGDVIVLAQCNYAVDAVWEDGCDGYWVEALCGMYVLTFHTFAGALLEVEVPLEGGDQ